MAFQRYMGYALIGVFSFSEQDDFNNLWRALRTLFALLNGDSILLLYQEVCPSDRSEGIGYCLWGQLYLYVGAPRAGPLHGATGPRGSALHEDRSTKAAPRGDRRLFVNSFISTDVRSILIPVLC